MYILVTGCSGFIGSHFCEKLLNNDLNVLGIDNFDPFYDPIIKDKNLRKLKSYKNFNAIPVIFLSSAVPDKTEEVGAEDCIIKPFEPEELLDKVKRYIG